MRIFKKSVYFLFESGSLDSPGGPSSNRRYSITGVLRRRVIMNFTSKGPAEAKSTITLRRIHLIRRPYAKRRGRRETMFDCPLSKTVKILDQRSCSKAFLNVTAGDTHFFFTLLLSSFGFSLRLRFSFTIVTVSIHPPTMPHPSPFCVSHPSLSFPLLDGLTVFVPAFFFPLHSLVYLL